MSPTSGEPPARAIARETISLAFLAVIQVLPPRQRAALILRDVLDWPVADVAAQLSPAAVNSARQRARGTLRSQLPIDQRETSAAAEPTAEERDVLTRYVRAYEAGDMQETMALIADDVRVTMPPAPYLFEGRAAIAELAGPAIPASGGCSRPGPTGGRPRHATCARGRSSAPSSWTSCACGYVDRRDHHVRAEALRRPRPADGAPMTDDVSLLRAPLPPAQETIVARPGIRRAAAPHHRVIAGGIGPPRRTPRRQSWT